MLSVEKLDLGDIKIIHSQLPSPGNGLFILYLCQCRCAKYFIGGLAKIDMMIVKVL